jgi:hypothetical protein
LIPVSAQTPIPPPVTKPEIQENTEENEPELMNEPKADNNPFLNPDLEGLIEKRISEDIWETMKGELPCVLATEDCVKQLQSVAVQNSRGLSDITEKIEEANNQINEAKSRNEQTISITTFSPFLQAYLQDFKLFRSGSTEELPNNPFEILLGNVASTLLGKGLGALFPIDRLFPQEGAVSRSIAIADLQIKVAELQRIKVELADKLRAEVLIESLKLEEIAREFQVQQEIAKRDRARLEIIKVSYQFGEGNSEAYLGQLSSYDRQKAGTWREWSKMRSQLTKVKILVLGVGEDP